ncbi:MAG: hypothetical protein NZL98_02260 [Anaerolineales bacterium]|nr:hypothetical protein [Anaerolineales bacterium]MDW8226598.1 hypothetical protein [Anaerolineales bacterium]
MEYAPHASPSTPGRTPTTVSPSNQTLRLRAFNQVGKISKTTSPFSQTFLR